MDSTHYRLDKSSLQMPASYRTEDGKLKNFNNQTENCKKRFKVLFQCVAPRALLEQTPTLIKIKKRYPGYPGYHIKYNYLKILNYTKHQFAVHSRKLFIDGFPSSIPDTSSENFRVSYAIAYHIKKRPSIIFIETIQKIVPGITDTSDSNPSNRRHIFKIYENEFRQIDLHKQDRPLWERIPVQIKTQIIINSNGLRVMKDMEPTTPSVVYFKKRYFSSEVILVNYTPHDITVDLMYRLFFKGEEIMLLDNFKTHLVAFNKKNMPEYTFIYIKLANTVAAKIIHIETYLDPLKGYVCENAYKRILKKRAFNLLWRATQDNDSSFYRFNLPLDISLKIIQNYLNV